jgi:hypothetical protein
VIDDLDIFARVGKDRALDFTFNDVQVADHALNILFGARVEFPCIAGIVVQGKDYVRKINCGGPAYKDYAADPAPSHRATSRDRATGDFYEDWALHQFGPEAGGRAAAIFSRIDGQLPRPSGWIGGPGGIAPDMRSWDEVAKDYAFVEEFERLRPRVKGAGNRERFDYWANTFRYLRAMARLNCAWGGFGRAMKEVESETDPQAKAKKARETALPARTNVVAALAEVYRPLLATVTNSSELGTIANWEQHIFPGLIDRPGRALADALGEALPGAALPSKQYGGKPRLIVAAVRTSVAQGEALTLKIMFLAGKAPRSIALYWRAMGRGRFQEIAATHVARGVYTVALPPETARDGDFEYYVKATPERGKAVYFPAAATEKIYQTVVVAPR